MHNPTSRLGQWIQRNNLTYGEVAALSGYSRSMISRAVRGERNLSPRAKYEGSYLLTFSVACFIQNDGEVVGDELVEVVDSVEDLGERALVACQGAGSAGCFVDAELVVPRA